MTIKLATAVRNTSGAQVIADAIDGAAGGVPTIYSEHVQLLPGGAIDPYHLVLGELDPDPIEY